jgi:DNA-3-methyladenine glycosylase
VREAGGVRRAGRIVEVEAYAGPEDRASHARFGPRSRAASMFGATGHAYVYGVYGMHTCLNVVAGEPGHPGAVLLRAAVPIAGADAMRAARLARAIATRRVDARDPGAAAARLARVADARLALGPGNLGAAFAVETVDNGTDLLDPGGSLRLEPRGPDDPAFTIAAGPRVGVAYAGAGWAEIPWRFSAARVGGAGDGDTH